MLIAPPTVSNGEHIAFADPHQLWCFVNRADVIPIWAFHLLRTCRPCTEAEEACIAAHLRPNSPPFGVWSGSTIGENLLKGA